MTALKWIVGLLIVMDIMEYFLKPYILREYGVFVELHSGKYIGWLLLEIVAGLVYIFINERIGTNMFVIAVILESYLQRSFYEMLTRPASGLL